jgi:hypothetical protein
MPNPVSQILQIPFPTLALSRFSDDFFLHPETHFLATRERVENAESLKRRKQTHPAKKIFFVPKSSKQKAY